jgi:hypothetical protein
MCNKNISLIVGIATGMTVGTLGVITGASMISTILIGTLIASIIHIMVISSDGFTKQDMQTEYR